MLRPSLEQLGPLGCPPRTPRNGHFGQIFLPFSTNEEVYVSLVTFQCVYYYLVRLYYGGFLWLLQGH